MANRLIRFGLLLGILFGVSPVVFSADLTTIEQRGYLIVGVKDNLRPLGFVDEQGILQGLEIDIATRLAEVLLGDVTAVQFRPLANSDRLAAVLNGEVDIAIAGISITPMRQRVVAFSLPYYLDGTGFVTNRANIQDLADLQGGAIAVLKGSEAIPVLQYTLPTARLVPVDSYQAAFNALEMRQVLAFAGDVTVLTGWVQEQPTHHLLPAVLTAEPLAIALPKGTAYDELRNQINQVLQAWHTDAWLEERATHWGLP